MWKSRSADAVSPRDSRFAAEDRLFLPVYRTSARRLADSDLRDLNAVRVECTGELAIQERGNVLRAWVLVAELWKFIQVAVVHLFQNLLDRGPDIAEIDADPQFIERVTMHVDVHDPVVAMLLLALAGVATQVVSGRKVLPDVHLVVSSGSRTVHLGTP